MSPQRLHTVFLALGSNLGERVLILEQARVAIEKRIGLLKKCSDVIETAPEGYTSHSPFLNQVIEVETVLEPLELLDITQEIERELGRSQKSAYGIYHDRTCDIDIILYDDSIIDTERLTIPHPRFTERLFVLQPLVEIAPNQIDPRSKKTIKELLWDVS